MGLQEIEITMATLAEIRECIKLEVNWRMALTYHGQKINNLDREEFLEMLALVVWRPGYLVAVEAAEPGPPTPSEAEYDVALVMAQFPDTWPGILLHDCLERQMAVPFVAVPYLRTHLATMMTELSSLRSDQTAKTHQGPVPEEHPSREPVPAEGIVTGDEPRETGTGTG